MNNAGGFEVRFWGVRGSIATPESANTGFGGNTPCVELAGPGQPPLIFDAGTGFRRLGMDLLRRHPGGARASIFLSHFHWDHLQGIPFFAPLYERGWRLDFFSPSMQEALRDAVEGQLRSPHFPAGSAVRAQMSWGRISDSVQVGDMTVSSFPLSHPDGCAGYRVETPSGAVVYATDHEHGNAEADATLRRRCQGAKVLIYDAQYAPEEIERRAGWGHSTWEEGVKAARDAGVRTLVLFHHDPERSDDSLRRILEQARAQFARVVAAREGEAIAI